MAWTKVAKPNTSNWTAAGNDMSRGNEAAFGFGNFGISNFGQGVNVAPDTWTKVSKPASSSWNKVAKPTS